MALEDRLRRRNKDESAVNKFDGGYPEAPIHGRLLAVLTLPFVPVFLYALYALFSSIALSLYMGFVVLYFLVLAAYFITEVAICPPWYHNTTPEQGLTPLDLPSYWQGIVHDPMVDEGLAYDDVEFVNMEGLTLRGWYVPGPQNATAAQREVGVVCVHGGGRDRRAWLRHVKLFHEAGWSVLLFDFAEHGTSDGKRRGFTFGVRERGDVKFAVRYMRSQHGHTRIAAVGTSVGGASVIMAAAEDRDIQAVVAENPVASPELFLVEHLRHMLAAYAPRVLADTLLAPFYKLVAWIFLFRIGSLWSRLDARAMVPRLAPTPLLLMHGVMDDLVPMEHTRILEAAANEPYDVWYAPDSWHCALYDRHPKEYAERVLGFLHRHLEAPLEG